MPYKISGTIIEAIFDDKARLIRLEPKRGEFHVTHISEAEARIKVDECVSGELKGELDDEKMYCNSHTYCEENMPPWYPFLRKCVKDSDGDCVCQYVPPEPPPKE